MTEEIESTTTTTDGAVETSNEVIQDTTIVETSDENISEEVAVEDADVIVGDEDASTEGSSDDADPEPAQGILKVKIDGEEKSFDLTDSDTLADLAKIISHSSAADKRMQDAALLQKQNIEFLKLIKTNPIEVLTDPRLEIDFRSVAEQYLVEQMKIDEMGEDDRNTYQKAKDYDRMVAEQKYRKEQDDADQETQAIQTLAVQLNTEIENAIMEKGMPLNESTFDQVRAIMLTNAENNVTVDATAAVNMLQTALRSIVEKTDADKLAELLGDSIEKKITKRKPKENNVSPDDQGERRVAGPAKPKKARTVSDFRAELGI